MKKTMITLARVLFVTGLSLTWVETGTVIGQLVTSAIGISLVTIGGYLTNIFREDT